MRVETGFVEVSLEDQTLFHLGEGKGKGDSEEIKEKLPGNVLGGGGKDVDRKGGSVMFSREGDVVSGKEKRGPKKGFACDRLRDGSALYVRTKEEKKSYGRRKISNSIRNRRGGLREGRFCANKHNTYPPYSTSSLPSGERERKKRSQQRKVEREINRPSICEGGESAQLGGEEKAWGNGILVQLFIRKGRKKSTRGTSQKGADSVSNGE